MALQVWLPLNKNGADKNQGLGDSTITNFGAVYESSGKLGGCYKCTNSAGIHIESKPWMRMIPGNSFSVSMWIKGCSENTWLIACSSWELIFRTNFLAIYPGGTISNGGCSIHQTFDSNTWYHIAFFYNGDTSKLSLYLNGEIKQEYITTYRQEGIASTITLPYGDTRYINDFRIYDHCLSPKEVKEIAKGLVLYYPLNDAYVEETSNLFIYPTPGSSCTNSCEWDKTLHKDAISVSGWSLGYNGGVDNPSTIYHAHWIMMDGFPTMRFPYITNSSNQTPVWLGISGYGLQPSDFISGVKYTVSFDAKADENNSAVSCGLYYRRNSSENWKFYDGNRTTTLTTDWKRYSVTYTSQGAYEVSSFYFYGVCSGPKGNRYIRNVQLEIKDHATPYTPNTRNETTVYDCSGYQNNGTIAGALSCSADSPRYKISTHFTSSIPSRIMLPSDMSCLSGNNEQTLSCWVKSSGLGSGMSFSGLISLGYGNTLSLDAWNYCYRIDNGSNLDALYSNQNPHDGKWHLVTATYKSGVASIYVDGVLKNSISRTFSNRYINNGLNCIGTETNNVNTNNINGDISDVRMYTTALSADDIKELYNTSCIINS